jgi:hypothetical protein
VSGTVVWLNDFVARAIEVLVPTFSATSSLPMAREKIKIAFPQLDVHLDKAA